MRVAVCLSGLCHSWNEAYPSLKETLLDKYDVDSFCAFWRADYTGVFESTAEEAIARLNPVDSVILDQIDLVKPFMDGYFRKSRIACFDKNFHNKTSEVITAWGRRNMLNLVYMIKQCNDLKKAHEAKNNFRYDIVIRLRPDRKWEFNLPLQTSKDTIFFHNLKGNLSDWACYGSSDLMDIYSEMWPNLQTLCAYQEPSEGDNIFNRGDCKAWRQWGNIHNVISTHLDFAAELRPIKRVDLKREDLRGGMVAEDRRREMHAKQMTQRGI